MPIKDCMKVRNLERSVLKKAGLSSMLCDRVSIGHRSNLVNVVEELTESICKGLL